MRQEGGRSLLHAMWAGTTQAFRSLAARARDPCGGGGHGSCPPHDVLSRGSGMRKACHNEALWSYSQQLLYI